jgi:hypothetical protein
MIVVGKLDTVSGDFQKEILIHVTTGNTFSFVFIKIIYNAVFYIFKNYSKSPVGALYMDKTHILEKSDSSCIAGIAGTSCTIHKCITSNQILYYS